MKKQGSRLEETPRSHNQQQSWGMGGGSEIPFPVPPLLNSRASIKDQLNQQKGVENILSTDIILPSSL